MDIASQVNIYYFPAMMLVVMWFDSWIEGPKNRSSRLFQTSLLLALAAMALEAAMWFMNDAGGFPPLVVLVANTAYLLVACASTLLWPAYLHVQLFDGRSLLERRGAAAAVIAPYLAMVVLIVANFTHGFIFTVDAARGYQRGPLFFIPYLLMMGYLVASAIAALAVRAREGAKDVRARYAILAGVGLLPVAGAAVQMRFYGWWVMWPSVVVMLLLVYLIVQNRRIENDPLTGLGNRRAFDRRLQAVVRHPSSEDGWCLALIDVDGLKAVNDSFGHAAGDEVLCRMADILRSALGGTDAFLARFGGDEFAVLAPCASDEEALALLAYLEREARREAERPGVSPIEFSAGYALSDRASQDADRLIERADAAMYRCKESRRHAASDADAARAGEGALR